MEKKYVGIALIIVSMLIFGSSALKPGAKEAKDTPNPKTGSPRTEPPLARAALVDSLYVSSPNGGFTSKLVGTLKRAGFTVDVYQGEEVTVDLLKALPEDYDLLALRMHSAVHGKGLDLYLFTAESYVRARAYRKRI